MNKHVTVATTQTYADELSRALTFPFRLEVVDQQSPVEIAQLLSGVDVWVNGLFKPEWQSKKSHLRLVQVLGAGCDGIDFASLPADCTVCNVYGHERAVTEHVFMFILALQRGLFELHAGMKKGNWTPQRPYLFELRNKKLLILGLGHIGKEVARTANFFGMDVVALTRHPAKEREKDLGLSALGGLDELPRRLPWADFVVVAIPSAPGTADLISDKEFQLMKPSASIINVGRAPVINEQALYEALRQRRIAGAGLDVWYQYPFTEQEIEFPSRFPLHELDNVIMTPHKPTLETMEYRWGKIADNIRRFAEDEPLSNVVIPPRKG